MFKASRWIRSLKNKVYYHGAVYEIESYDHDQVWFTIQTSWTAKGPEWEYLVMSKDVALSIAERLQYVANSLPD